MSYNLLFVLIIRLYAINNNIVALGFLCFFKEMESINVGEIEMQ